jgi:tRNA modification GTPase
LNFPPPSNVCSQSTPIGRGAVAVVAVHGSQAEATIDECLLIPTGKPLSSRTNQDVAYGIWKSTGEDLVVSKRGDQHFEIHCHGGTTACQAIIRSLGSFGFFEISAIEFANRFQDFWQVTTQLALTQATTPKTATFLLRLVAQLPLQIQQLRNRLAANDWDLVAEQIQSMLHWSDFGMHLTVPRSVVLCGKPNVGKSSLVNAMAGFQRAIVHDVAGTTRDVVSQAIAIDGWPVTLKDTAGIRNSDNPIEIMGIAQAKEQISKSDLTICVFDARDNSQSKQSEIISQTKPDLIILNKIDLLSSGQAVVEDTGSGLPTIKTSVKTNAGIRELIDILGTQLAPKIPSASQTYPVTTEQNRRLAETLACLHQETPATLGQLRNLLGKQPTADGNKA